MVIGVNMDSEVLSMCKKIDGATPNDIARHLGISPADVAMLLLRLQKQGKIMPKYDEKYDVSRPFETIKWVTLEDPTYGNEPIQKKMAEGYTLLMTIPQYVQATCGKFMDEARAIDFWSFYDGSIQSATDDVKIICPFIDDFSLYPIASRLKSSPALKLRIITEEETYNKISQTLRVFPKAEMRTFSYFESSKQGYSTKLAGIHMKTIIIDKQVAIVGSFNLTKSHLYKNIDVGFAFPDAPTIKRFEDLFECIWEVARPH